jgi:O-antigen/teichoic acid export membrane protein
MLTLRRLLEFCWLIVDQAVFALSNFAMNVLFARWLKPTDYGLFAVSFTGYLFLTVIHWGAFLEPLLVLSAQISADRRRSYVVTLGLVHVLMILAAMIISGAVFALCSHLGSPDTGWAVVGAGIGGSMMLMLITARRLCLVFLSPRISATVGVAYCIGVLGSGSLLVEYDLSWFNLWELMGFWSLLCSGLIFLLLYLRTEGTEPYPLRRLFAFQSQYAPGAIVASICNWASFDGVYLILAHMLGLTAVAQTRAVFTLANPLVHVNQAMHASWLVMFSEQAREGQKPPIWRIAGLYGAAIGGLVFILFCTARPLVNVVYGGRYLEAAWQLPLFVTVIGLTGIAAMITSLFKSRGSLLQGFLPQVVSAAVALSVAVWLIKSHGQAGAIYALISGSLSALLTASLTLLFFGPKDATRPRDINERQQEKRPSTRFSRRVVRLYATSRRSGS